MITNPPATDPGTPVVFLHGWLGSPSDFDSITKHMGRRNCVCLPLPKANSWADGIENLIEKLPPKCHLVGYSMGARVAVGCALLEPTRFASLSLACGNPGLGAAERQERRTHDQLVSERLRQVPIETFLRDWYSQDVFKGLSTSALDSLVSLRLGLVVERHAKLMTTYSVAEQPDFRTDLDSLEIPKLTIWGERDSKYREILSRVQGAEQLEIPDCGHAVPFEKPRIFAEAVSNFVSSHDPGPGAEDT